MGYNTQVLIMNDALDALEEHPEQFVTGIVRQLHNGGDVSVGGYVNAATVIPTAHADRFRLLASHGNLMLELSFNNERTREIARRDAHGLSVVQGYAERAMMELQAFLGALEMERARTDGRL